MASDPVSIAWVVSESFKPKDDQIEKMKAKGPIWGPSKQQSKCELDFIVCTEYNTAKHFMNRRIQDRAHIWLSESLFQKMGHPDRIQTHKHSVNPSLEQPEDLLSLLLAGERYSVILAVGFNVRAPATSLSKLKKFHHMQWLSSVSGIIKNYDQTQWVFLDVNKPAENFTKYDHCTFDKLKSVL